MKKNRAERISLAHNSRVPSNNEMHKNSTLASAAHEDGTGERNEWICERV